MNLEKTGSCENLCFDKLCVGFALVMSAVVSVGLTGLSAICAALLVVAVLYCLKG